MGSRIIILCSLILFLTACGQPNTAVPNSTAIDPNNPQSAPNAINSTSGATSTVSPTPIASYIIIQCPQWSGFPNSRLCYFIEKARVTDKTFHVPMGMWNAAVVDNSSSNELHLKIRNCRVTAGNIPVVKPSSVEQQFLLPSGTYIIYNLSAQPPYCEADIEIPSDDGYFRLNLARVNN